MLLSQFVENGKHVVDQVHNFHSSDLWANGDKAIQVAEHNSDAFKILQFKVK